MCRCFCGVRCHRERTLCCTFLQHCGSIGWTPSRTRRTPPPAAFYGHSDRPQPTSACHVQRWLSRATVGDACVQSMIAIDAVANIQLEERRARGLPPFCDSQGRECAVPADVQYLLTGAPHFALLPRDSNRCSQATTCTARTSPVSCAVWRCCTHARHVSSSAAAQPTALSNPPSVCMKCKI